MTTLSEQLGSLKELDLNSNPITESLLESDGYVKIGSIIIQWGISESVSPEASGSVTFPKQFPKACFTVVPGTYCAAGASSDVWGQINSFDKTGFTWFAQASGDIVDMRVTWIAIGY